MDQVGQPNINQEVANESQETAPETVDSAGEIVDTGETAEQPSQAEVQADTIAMEQPAIQPAQPAVPTVVNADDTNDQTVVEPPKKEDFSTAISDKITKSEKPWLKEAKDIIKEFDDNPYEEEEASEALNKKYLKNRFGVDISDTEGK